MYTSNIEGLKNSIIVEYSCDNCNNITQGRFISAKRNFIKYEKHLCKKCIDKQAAAKRPQCSKNYWESAEVKANHSASVKTSEKYKTAISNRDVSGEKNGMFGKTASIETRDKMSKSREGKVQSLETINKRRETSKRRHEEKIQSGVKMIHSVNYELKRYINRTCKWAYRIYERDKWKCSKCDSTSNLDAHHIKPFATIIKESLINTDFKTDLEKYNYLKTIPELLDEDLTNGITLCRSCHKEVHLNWGSHYPNTQQL
jgi:hypothetical protein